MAYSVVEIICPKLCKPTPFEVHQANFKAQMLKEWIKTDTDMGLYAPLRIIFARDALLSAAAKSKDAEFKARAELISQKVDHYVLANSKRPDWENLNQGNSDALIGRAKHIPANYRERDAEVLERVLLESITP